MDPKVSVQKKGSNNPFPDVFGGGGSDEELEKKISKKMHSSKDNTPNQAEQAKLENSLAESQQPEPPKTGLLFGQPQAGGLFGSQSNGQPKTGGGLFTQATSNQLAQSQTDSAKTTGGLFGAPQVADSKSLFGKPQQGEAGNSTSPSGSKTDEVAKPTGLFAGISSTQSGEAAKPTSLFGAQPSQPTGNSPTQSGEGAKPTGLFAGITATQSGETSKPSSLFGGQISQPTGNTPTQSGEAAKPASLFAGQTSQPGNSLFGQQQQTTAVFGQTRQTKPTEPAVQGESPKPASLFGGQIGEAGKQQGEAASPSVAQTGEITKPSGLFAGITSTQSGEAAKPSSLFGTQSSQSTGNTPTQSGEAAKPTGLFVGTTATQSGEAAKPSSLFAGQTSQPGKPLFGQQQQQGESPKPTSLFGGQIGETGKPQGEAAKPTSPSVVQSGEAVKPTGLFAGITPTQSGEAAKPASLFGTQSSQPTGNTPTQSSEAAKPTGLFPGVTSTQSGEAAKPSSLFGGQTSQAGKPLFGQQQQQGESPKPTSLFGGQIGETGKPQGEAASPSVAQTGDIAKPSGLFAGTTATQSGETSKPSSLFGAPSQPTGNTPTQSGEGAKPTGLFAGITSTQSGETAKPSSLFAGQASQPGNPLFGQQQQTTAVFGQTRQTKPTEPAVQGESPKPASLFGGQITQPGKPLFGQPQQGEAAKPLSPSVAQTGETAKPSGLFPGATSTQSGETAKPSSLFGGQITQPGKPLFGQPQQGEAAKPVSPSVAQTGEITKPSGLFPGATSTQSGDAAKPSSLFGGQISQPTGNTPTQSGEGAKPTGLFAGTTSTQSGEAVKPSSLFGGQTSQAGKPLFGQQQQQGESPKPTSLFGGQTSQTSQPGKPLFGQQQQQTEQSKPMSLFGAQSTQPSKTEEPTDLPVPALEKKDSEIKWNIFGPVSQSPFSTPTNIGNTAPKTDETKDKEPKDTPGSSNKSTLFGQPAAQASVFSPGSSGAFSGFSGMLSQAKSSFLDKGLPAAQPQTTSLFTGVFNENNPRPTAKPLFAGAKAATETVDNKETAQKSQPVTPLEFDNPNTFKVALEKEKRATEKLAALVKGIEENRKLFSSTLQSQEKEIDAFFEEYNKKLPQRVYEAAEKCKQTLKAKLRSEHQNYDATSTQVQKLLREISETNQFSKILENTDKTEAVKKYLANSLELQAGYTPLVKKYKLLKSTLPSVRTLTSRPKTKVITKDDLLECTERIPLELEKLQKRLEHEIIHAPSPLQSFIGSIEAIAKATPSMLPPKYPHDPSLGPHANAKNMKQVVYKLGSEDIKAVANPSIFPDSKQIVYLTQPGSLQHDVLVKDLISYQGAPRKVVRKVISSSPDSFDELTLENIFDGKTEHVKLSNKQRQAQDLVLTDDYIVTKVNPKTGFYTLVNIDNQKTNTRVQIKLASPDLVLGAKVKSDLEKLLKENKKAVVKTLCIDQEEIIVACDELRSKKVATK